MAGLSSRRRTPDAVSYGLVRRELAPNRESPPAAEVVVLEQSIAAVPGRVQI